ncbi:GNAT family N-acetyltransferase [Streptomyces sp. RB6PN25]|uniref:GNAT family N-acetyltransferase n=1 Tax=Streptomyces humicola TaxID=2953240 RepID=A0ABT1PRH7_9ACTN|nr:GNAT family N-acetyltransferase [Streptomyces humicola]MCQ4080277.1 GNAT family N-acetyltransferase [Streptomyces humicola]
MDEITFRRATEADVARIVALLADDSLGAVRESPEDLAPYRAAFKEADEDPRNMIIVAERDGAVIGTAQLTIIAGLSRRAAKRAQIEGVRVAAEARGTGLGSQLIEWCVERSRDEGCTLVQLTSDATRIDAHRFYEKLGFQASHIGFKLPLR